MELFEIFSTEFDSTNQVYSLAMLRDKVNKFIRETSQVRGVEWIQTRGLNTTFRLTAIITYTVMRQARSLEG